MKIIMKRWAACFFIASLLSCSGGYGDDYTPPPVTTTTFNATLNGSSEVPANSSTATGTATASFNNSTKILTVSVTYSGLTATNGHIHKGAVGVSGDVIFPFSSFTSPISYTSMALTNEQEADLMSNLYYVNIHSAAFPAGEIRGQLIKYVAPAGGGGY
jgi:hypothetical protein